MNNYHKHTNLIHNCILWRRDGDLVSSIEILNKYNSMVEEDMGENEI